MLILIELCKLEVNIVFTLILGVVFGVLCGRDSELVMA